MYIWNIQYFIIMFLHAVDVEAKDWDLAVVGRVTDDLVVGLYVDGTPVDGIYVVDTVVVVDAVVGATVVVVAVVDCFVVVVGTRGVVVVVLGVVVVVVVVVVGAGVVVVVVVAGVVVVVVVGAGVVVLVDGGVWVDVGKLRSPLQFRVRKTVESSTTEMICFLVYFFLILRSLIILTIYQQNISISIFNSYILYIFMYFYFKCL